MECAYKEIYKQLDEFEVLVIMADSFLEEIATEQLPYQFEVNVFELT